MRELLLGIDIGTSSTKALLARPDGTVVGTARRAHRIDRPRPGWAEQDAEAVWWPEVAGLCRELVAAHGAPAAVCVSGMGPCLLPADSDGRALRPAILYGIDVRAEEEIRELEATLGADRILAAGGSPLTSQAVGPKLAWLRRHEPDVFAATRMLLMPSSFVVHRLTGAYVLDHHSASQCDPLYDLAGERWREDWAEQIAPGLPLPALAWPGEPVGHVSAEAAAATGLPQGLPVAAGTIDAWAEALSVGVREEGDTMVMYGSTMFLIGCVAEPVPTPQLWHTTGVLPGSRTVAGGMATSGSVTDWLADLAGAGHETLLAEAAAVGAGCDGLLVLPYFDGERTPLFDADARGVFAGLTLRHTRGHLYRALLEATAFGVRHNLEAMPASGSRRLVAVGGGTQGALWAQIVSDVCGRAQDLPEQRIGACYGDAWLAGVAAGRVDAAGSWARTAGRIEPDDRWRGRYDELYGLYRGLYAETRDTVHRLAEAGREWHAPSSSPARRR